LRRPIPPPCGRDREGALSASSPARGRARGLARFERRLRELREEREAEKEGQSEPDNVVWFRGASKMDVMYQIIFTLLFIASVIYIRYKYFHDSNQIRPWRRGNPIVLLVISYFIIYDILNTMFHYRP
jgi:hypothetical protein